MAARFIDEIWYKYLKGSMLVRIIIINVVVFLVLRILAFVAMFGNIDIQAVQSWVELPGNLSLLVRRPWTLVTFMFVHYGVLHILFNMLWFYWLGRIFMEFFSPKQLTGLYLMGGWGGALLYLLVANLLPHLAAVDHFLVGSSVSVLAIIVATAVYVPDYKIGLLFFGEVSIKWIAIVSVLLLILGVDITSLGDGVAHIGGVIVGALYALCIKRGTDITRPLNAVIDAIVGLFNGHSFKRISFKRTAKAGGQQRASQQPSRQSVGGVSEDELDTILKKIKVSGYDALTDEERDKLFKVSRGPKS